MQETAMTSDKPRDIQDLGAAGAPPGCYYSAYLQLDRLFGSQRPASVAAGRPAHDEWLFITVHQVYELWFKQILHELDRIEVDFSANPVDDRVLGRVNLGLQRIHEILKLLVHQLDVMETMTPLDFLDFRDLLYPASGFQSVQFREIEIRLGLRSDERLTFDHAPFESKLSDTDRERLRAASQRPSLLSLLDRWLSRTPFVDWGGTSFRDAYRTAVIGMLEADAARVRGDVHLSSRQRDAEALAIEAALKNFADIFDEGAQTSWTMSPRAVEAALLITLYRDEPALNQAFRLIQSIMDVDETMTLWRYRHALMVNRMLGVKPGTGGSSGHDYLRATAEQHGIFRDLFRLSTYLIPRSALPRLPESVARRTSFVYATETRDA
jgi:tryptophan 2,3-dioxygenase